MKSFPFLAFAALAVAVLAGGCQTTPQQWQQIAVGTGQIVNAAPPKIVTVADSKVAKASEQLSKYCGLLQIAAQGATIFSPAKYQAVAQQASAGLNALCAEPPTDVASAAVAAAKVYTAVVTTQQAIEEP